MNIVEENGGLRNTLAMGFYDVGYKSLTAVEQKVIDRQIDELGVCPTCAEKPTFQDASGTFYDSHAHFWKVGRT